MKFLRHPFGLLAMASLALSGTPWAQDIAAPEASPPAVEPAEEISEPEAPTDAEAPMERPPDEPQKIVMVPVKPIELLAMMPPELDGWYITKSEAEHQLDEILFCRAVREFTEVVPQNLVRKVTPRVIRVEIYDTCKDRNLTSLFSVSREDLFDHDLRPGHWRKNPAILVDQRDGVTETVQVLFDHRFLVNVTYTGKNYNLARPWLEAMNIDFIENYQPYIFRNPPRTFQMELIDQKNPKRNRSYRITVPSEENKRRHAEMLEQQYEFLGLPTPPEVQKVLDKYKMQPRASEEPAGDEPEVVEDPNPGS